LGIGESEDGFDRAAFCARANEGFVGAFAEDEFEGADDDGLSRAGFAGDGGEAWGEEPGEFFDESEVTDAERSEGSRHG
jgi:hypothetical protein